MVKYVDTADPGAGDIVQGGSFYYALNGQWVYIAIVNNLIVGQSVGQPAQLKFSGPAGLDYVSVPYGQSSTTRIRASWVKLTMAVSPNADVRIRIDDENVRLTVQTVQATVGTTNVNIAQVGGVAQGSQTLATSSIITDAAGNNLGVNYLGGGAAPANGIWRFDATLAVAGTPLTVNGTTVLPIGAESAAGLPTAAMTYEVQVVKGTTYAVVGGTVVFGAVGGAG